MKFVAIVSFLLGVTGAAAEAGTLVSFGDQSNGAITTGSASTLDAGGNGIAETFGDTSPFDAQVAGFGLSNGGLGNLDGFTGSPDFNTAPPGVSFDFVHDSLGSVPQFSSDALLFGDVTGPNVNLVGGFPSGANIQTPLSLFTGSLASLAEEEIAAGLLVPFPGVGGNGELGDAASGVDSPGASTQTITQPEPASMLLLGSGLVYLARRRLKSAKA